MLFSASYCNLKPFNNFFKTLFYKEMVQAWERSGKVLKKGSSSGETHRYHMVRDYFFLFC